MNKEVCSIDLFQNVLEKLNNNFDDCFLDAAQLSTITSFGTIYSNRGSVRVLPSEGITSLNLVTEDAKATFTTCTIKNLAIIIVPISSLPISLKLHIRFTSSSSVIDEVDEIIASIGGSLMLTYSLTSNSIQYSRPNIDITFNGEWASSVSSWPTLVDKDPDLVESIKMNDVLNEYLTQLKKTFNARLMQKFIRSNDEALGCIVSQHEPMVCTKNMVAVPNYCHPCDTCCNCMVRQICDGECSNCPCVDCSQNNNYVVLYTISFLLLLCSIFIVWRIY